MSIRAALNSLPSKPGLIIAVILIVTVLSFYYLNQYRLCRTMVSLRTNLYSSIEQSKNNEIDLIDIIPFEWDKVRIILDFQNKGKLLDCPFNWGWTQEQRKQLMEKGQLNVIAFARKNGNTVIDFDAEIVNFDLAETVFIPSSARFRVNKSGSNKTQYLLSHIK